MKAKFVGDPNDPKAKDNLPDSFTAHGVAFPKGKFVDVPDAKAEKFENNSHFETQGKTGDAGAKRAEKVPEVEGELDDSEHGSLPSTTGDPETMSRETAANISIQGREATDPMGEPGPGPEGASGAIRGGKAGK